MRKEYGQKCESGTKIAPCAIIYTGGSNTEDDDSIRVPNVQNSDDSNQALNMENHDVGDPD